MKATLISLLILSFLVYVSADYNSNENPLNYLNESGYYDIITEVACTLDPNFAISLCQELAPGSHCYELVNKYITCQSSSSSESEVKNDLDDSDKNKSLELLMILMNNIDIFRKNGMTTSNIRNLVNNIINKKNYKY